MTRPEIEPRSPGSLANALLIKPMARLRRIYSDKEVLSFITQPLGARGVVVIVVGIGHGDTSSNPGRD